jgi:hypothetical protein
MPRAVSPGRRASAVSKGEKRESETAKGARQEESNSEALERRDAGSLWAGQQLTSVLGGIIIGAVPLNARRVTGPLGVQPANGEGATDASQARRPGGRFDWVAPSHDREPRLQVTARAADKRQRNPGAVRGTR